MPRYFFNVFDDGEYIKDARGVELTGPLEAKAELKRLLQLLPERLLRPGVRVAVLDESGQVLDEVWAKVRKSG